MFFFHTASAFYYYYYKRTALTITNPRFYEDLSWIQNWKTKLRYLMKKRKIELFKERKRKEKLNYSKKKKKAKIHVPTLALLTKDVRGLIFLSTCDCVMFLKTALLLPISLLNTLCRNFHDYISIAIRTCIFIDSEFFVCPSYRFYPCDISLEKEILEIRRWKKYLIMHLNNWSDYKMS